MKKNQRGFSTVVLAIIVVVVAVAAVAGWLVYNNSQDDTTSKITNFEECVAAGNPVMDSYPEQCSANGQTFVKEQ